MSYGTMSWGLGTDEQVNYKVNYEVNYEVEVM